MQDEAVSDLLRVKLLHSSGKRTFDRASKERLVKACLRPGVSVSRLALENNVNANQLRKWISQYRLLQQGNLTGFGDKREEADTGSAFLPIEVVAMEDRDEHSPFELPRASQGSELPAISDKTLVGSAQLSATLPNGVRLSLEMSDASVLVSMIGALGNVPSFG